MSEFCSAGPKILLIFFLKVKMVDAILDGAVDFAIRIQWKNG
ncbi:MAG: hypothetical protein O3A40_04970 [Bacteroidetes bacterium]|nr:hypothetical protein [Bacteroidota bacterium]